MVSPPQGHSPPLGRASSQATRLSSVASAVARGQDSMNQNGLVVLDGWHHDASYHHISSHAKAAKVKEYDVSQGQSALRKWFAKLLLPDST